MKAATTTNKKVENTPQFFKHIEKMWNRQRKRREKLMKEAHSEGLKPISENSLILVSQDYQLSRHVLPKSFYMMSGVHNQSKLTLKKYTIQFPIHNLEELKKTLEALNAFYANTKDAIHYMRDGIEGLIEFMRKVKDIK